VKSGSSSTAVARRTCGFGLDAARQQSASANVSGYVIGADHRRIMGQKLEAKRKPAQA